MPTFSAPTPLTERILNAKRDLEAARDRPPATHRGCRTRAKRTARPTTTQGDLMRRKLAHLLRRVARVLIRWSNKLDPPVVKSPAQHGIDLANASIQRMGREASHNSERMRLDMQYHAQMAVLGFR